MRVLLLQTAKGLSSSSGGYKANLSLLRYLAYRKHATAQLCFVWDSDISAYCDEKTTAGKNFDLETGIISMPVNETTEAFIRTYSFTDDEGIKNIAINASDFMEAVPEEDLAHETARFIEV
jgi:hypothetical protein